MNILALVGSPRRLGNSELMAKEISRRIPDPHRLKLVRLPEMDIRIKFLVAILSCFF
jgi:multimeric flavodoxin WrbA